MRLSEITADKNARQLVKFILVGLLTTSINFAVYAFLVLTGVPYLAAAIIAFVLATLNSYTWNRRWTFRAGAHHNQRLAKFAIVQSIGLGINLLALALLVEYAGLQDHKLIAQLISNAFVVASNYAGNKWWTFRE